MAKLTQRKKKFHIQNVAVYVHASTDTLLRIESLYVNSGDD